MKRPQSGLAQYRRKPYEPPKFTAASFIRTTDGKTFTGIDCVDQLMAYVRRLAEERQWP